LLTQTSSRLSAPPPPLRGHRPRVNRDVTPPRDPSGVGVEPRRGLDPVAPRCLSTARAAPASTSRRAAAKPNPCGRPVTSATRPVRSRGLRSNVPSAVRRQPHHRRHLAHTLRRQGRAASVVHVLTLVALRQTAGPQMIPGGSAPRPGEVVAGSEALWGGVEARAVRQPGQRLGLPMVDRHVERREVIWPNFHVTARVLPQPGSVRTHAATTSSTSSCNGSKDASGVTTCVIRPSSIGCRAGVREQFEAPVARLPAATMIPATGAIPAAGSECDFGGSPTAARAPGRDDHLTVFLDCVDTAATVAARVHRQ